MIVDPVAIIGGHGAIGAAVSQYLQDLGHEIVLLDPRQALPRHSHFGTIIYAAGRTADFRKFPIETVEAHCGSLVDVINGCTWDRFLFLSSTRVYLGAASGTEDTPLQVEPGKLDAVYNASKLAGEALVLHCGRPGCHVVRLSNVIIYKRGSRDFLSSILDDALTKGHVRLNSSPDLSKDYISLPDTVRYIAAIAAAGRHCIYNVASGMSLTNRQVLDSVADITGCSVSFPDNAEAGAPFPSIDNDRVVSEFGPVSTDPLQAIYQLAEDTRARIKTDHH